jgi:hypothetical protein
MFGKSTASKSARKVAEMGARKMRSNGEPDEGRITKTIERRTADVPSIVFLVAAGASILGALGMRASGRKDDAQFIGQWAPTFLILGLYNKIVKTTGHD